MLGGKGVSSCRHLDGWLSGRVRLSSGADGKATGLAADPRSNAWGLDRRSHRVCVETVVPEIANPDQVCLSAFLTIRSGAWFSARTIYANLWIANCPSTTGITSGVEIHAFVAVGSGGQSGFCMWLSQRF